MTRLRFAPLIAGLLVFSLVALQGCATLRKRAVPTYALPTSPPPPPPNTPPPPPPKLQPRPPVMMPDVPAIPPLPPTAARPIVVKGFVLTPDQAVPATALGYAVPIFRTRSEAATFCPHLLDRLEFAGRLTRGTPLTAQSAGVQVDVAPFVWPVVSWQSGTPVTCANLVRQYDLSSAQAFLSQAQSQIRTRTPTAKVASGAGPFVLTARRINAHLVLYDLSTAPPYDYPDWVGRIIARLSDTQDPAAGRELVVPTPRDQLRGYVFGAAPFMSDALGRLLKGFKPEGD